MNKTLYQQCSQAVTELMAEPPAQHGGVFTEIDVQSKAATRAWSTKDFEESFKPAAQVCGTKYRERKLCRYGPVDLPNGAKDYARIATKMVYADAQTGPDFLETPNGVYPKLMIEDDPVISQGRKHCAARSDIIPWEDQDINPSPVKVETTAQRAKRLKKDLAKTKARLTKSEAKIQTLNKEVAKILDDHAKRLETLEARDRQRAKIAVS